MGALAELGARELAPGLWRWTAFHPEWKQDVGCFAIDAPGALVLIDPLLPEAEAAWAALDRAIESRGRAEIVLSVFWHDRSAKAIAERQPGTPVRAEAGNVARLGGLISHPFQAGDPLPAGLAAHPTPREGEVVLWSPAHRALIAGDVILGGDGGDLRLCPASWLPEGVSRSHLAAALAPLLDLPVERVLLGHGEPVLERATGALQRAFEAARLEERPA